MLQTRDGYLWAGTRLGLARFDGVRFTLFDKTETRVLEQAFPKALLEDRDGVLWIGAKDGLIRMNRGEFERFRSQDGLCDDEVASLAAGRNDGLWIGTDGGVSRFKDGKFTNYVNSSLDHKHVYSICEATDGTVWVGFSAGLYQLDAETGVFHRVWTSVGKLPRLHYDTVTAIYQDQRDRIWFGTLHGLYRFDQGVVTDYSGEEGVGGEIRAIFGDARGMFWIVATDELFEFDEHRFRPAGLKEKVGDLRLQSGCVDREGNLWIGSAYGGLNRLQPRHLNVFSTKDGLSHNDVWSVSEGRDGTVWIGTSDGVTQFNGGRFQEWRPPFRRQDWSMRSVIQDTAGGVWFGSAFGGTDHIQQTNSCWLEVQGLPGGQTRVVFEARSQTVWIGSRESLNRMLPTPQWMWIDGQGIVNTHAEKWIYTSNEVVRVFGKQHWVFDYASSGWEHHATGYVHHAQPKCPIEPYRLEFPRDDWATNLLRGRLSHYDVRAILQDRAGVLWFGTADGGVNRLQNDEFSAVTMADGLASNQVTALHEDTDGVLWIGTSGGLSRFKAGRFDSITVHEGLFDNLVNQILEDDFGNLWIGTKRGIYRVSRRELNEVADGRAPPVRCIVFGEADGMLSSETNGQVQPAGCKTGDGRLWFPTTHGVVVIDPSSVRMNDSPPPVIIEEVHAADVSVFKNGKPVRANAHSAHSTASSARFPINLPPGSGRSLELFYTANSLTAPERVQFKYRLLGHDKSWVDARNRRLAHYTNLKPGRYEFHVVACNNHNLWNMLGARFAFTVLPFYWQTWWFRTAITLAAAGLITLLVWWYRHTVQLKHEVALRVERERIARDMHDEIGSHLSQISLLLPESSAAGELTRTANQSLDEIVWAVQPDKDNLPAFAMKLSAFAFEYLNAAGLELDLSVPVELPVWELSAKRRHNLLLVTREALRNVVQHAYATQVRVGLEMHSTAFTLEIADNGRGFETLSALAERSDTPQAGHGLRNIRRRVAEIGAELRLRSRSGEGTDLRVTVPKS